MDVIVLHFAICDISIPMTPSPKPNSGKRQFLTSWRTGRTPYLTHHYSAAEWQSANYKRRINDLTARIQSGKSWLATIATIDPRHPVWTQKIAALQAERAVLQRRLIAR